MWGVEVVREKGVLAHMAILVIKITPKNRFMTFLPPKALRAKSREATRNVQDHFFDSPESMCEVREVPHKPSCTAVLASTGYCIGSTRIRIPTSSYAHSRTGQRKNTVHKI